MTACDERFLRHMGILLNGKKTALSNANSGNDQLQKWSRLDQLKRLK